MAACDTRVRVRRPRLAFALAATSALTLIAPAQAPAAGEPPLAKLRVGPGVATFGQALPSGAARDALRLGGLRTQTDVKTRWPDGSIRFAVVSARVKRTGTYELRSGRPAGGRPTRAKVPATVVELSIAGTRYVARLPRSSAGDRWLNGPVVHEWRRVLAPVAPDGRRHPSLRVIFDARAYDGGARVDVTVENAINRAGAGAVTYDVVIRSGRRRFSRAGVRHAYLTRWRSLFGTGTRAARVRPDFRSAQRAGALPRYLRLIDRRVDRVRGESFGILGRGSLDPYMPNHGGRPELAPYPDWAARYLAHRDPRQLPFVLAHGDLAGSWPVHIREPDGTAVSLDRKPGFWLDPRGAGEADGPLGDLTQTGDLVPDNAHQPSLAYIPYLVTGDRYYADEMALWANYVMLRTWFGENGSRGGSQGLLVENETRGIAWGLRNMIDAAAYLPDGDPMKPYLEDKVRNNLRWLDRYAAEHQNPLGVFFDGQSFEDEGTDRWSIPRPWQNNYVAWALDRAAAQGFSDGNSLRDALVRFQLRLFTDPGYPRERAAPYYLVVGRVNADGGPSYFTSFAEVADATDQAVRERGEEHVPFAGWYGVDARLMLLIARRDGMAGADEAYAYLWPRIAQDPHIEGIPDLALRAGWAIAGPGER